MADGVQDGDKQYADKHEDKKSSRLQQLLTNPRVWRSGHSESPVNLSIPTGFGVLDEWLGGGWPVGVLTELLIDQEGAGELRLLMPALAGLSQPHAEEVGSRLTTPLLKDEAWIAWIAPPHIPYPPALKQHGVDVSRVLVTHSDNQKDILWAMEQSLRSAVCSVVLAWIGDVGDKQLRRLQLAAEHGACWAVIFRSNRFAQSASPAPLRICIQPGSVGPELEIFRNRYGRVGRLSLPC